MRFALVALAFLLVCLPAGAADARAAFRLGMDAPSLDAAAAQGLPTDYASTWAGVWLQTWGWDAFDRDVERALDAGATPVVQLWYWGDSISPACIEQGCHDALHGAELSRAGWDAMADTMAAHLAARLAGREAIVIVETEFNKNGVDAGPAAAVLDAGLARQMDVLHAVPGVRTALGFGDWAHENWGRFPQALARADLLGFQAMRGYTRHTDDEYRAAPDAVLAAAQELRARFGKPLLLDDLALSSWGGAWGESVQADALRGLAERADALREAGVEGIVYRSFADDPGMDPANYFGEAEKAWGLTRADGTPKPALEAWRALAGRDDAAPPAAPRAPAWKTEAA